MEEFVEKKSDKKENPDTFIRGVKDAVPTLMVILSMFVLSAFFPSYIAIILSTVVVATIGVLLDR